MNTKWQAFSILERQLFYWSDEDVLDSIEDAQTPLKCTGPSQKHFLTYAVTKALMLH